MKNKGQAKKGTMKRLIRMLFEFYPVLLPLVLVCIILNALISSIPAVFQQNIIAVVEQYWQTKDWAAAAPTVTRLVLILVVLYALSLAAGYAYSYGMAIITQGSLKKMREKMFNRMQDLPIKYFDTHNHGDIMSYYTNDIDTLRQLISQSIPQLMISCITVVTIFSIMLYYSMWLLLVVLCGVALMFVVTKKVGSSSAHFFLKQQIAVGKTEGFVEEIMNGQKVVKVFSHETETKKDFDRVNDELFEMSCQANRYANMLMPILMQYGQYPLCCRSACWRHAVIVRRTELEFVRHGTFHQYYRTFFEYDKTVLQATSDRCPIRSTQLSWVLRGQIVFSACWMKSRRQTMAM